METKLKYMDNSSLRCASFRMTRLHFGKGVGHLWFGSYFKSSTYKMSDTSTVASPATQNDDADKMRF